MRITEEALELNAHYKTTILSIDQHNTSLSTS